MKFSINPEIKYQTMEGFGASGAWWAQEVGGWNNADEIAELLYSKEKGIGLRTYRYNLGAGSQKSGKGEYSDSLRRSNLLINKSGEYDNSEDSNAVAMMRKCVNAGAEEVVLFVNSPAESLTKNGMAHTTKHKIFTTNLSKKNYDAFAKYVTGAAKHFLKQNIPVKFISPINEPFWVWNGGQEGCHYSPNQCRRVMKAFAKHLTDDENLKGVKLSGVENGDIRWFNHLYTHSFLKEGSIRDLTDGIDVHSYFLPLPLPSFFNDRLSFLKRYRKWMNKHYPTEKIRVSEWCHMQGGRDASMHSALECAKVISEDIAILNACSFQHWIACSPYDYCDGLIYIYPETKTYELTKRYYVTGQFSKFIPENAERIQITNSDEQVKALAFEKDGAFTVIFINPTGENKCFEAPADCDFILTDEKSNMCGSKHNKGDKITITPQSVSTLIYSSER